LLDINPKVADFLKQRHANVIEGDIFRFEFDKKYDVVSIGIQYELLPSFLEKKGKELSQSAGMVIIQSGCTGFFEFEHDWIMGKKDSTDTIDKWPWFKDTQTIRKYFPNVAEVMWEYQTAIIASHQPLEHLSHSLRRDGFKKVKYENWTLF
jgi:hypothetical protein